MLQSERRLGIFHEKVREVMDDAERNVQPVHVVLPDRREADVALKVWMSPNMDRLIIRGVARYLRGHVVGEHHIQRFQLDPDWMVGHTHSSRAKERCVGFIYNNGRFLPSSLVCDQEPWGDIDLRDKSLDWSGEILNGLLTTDSSASVFAPDGGVALRRARLLRGTGAPNELLVDAALCQALDARLAAIEG